ncbi:dockerin type I domain-containing protein [Planctomycetaceae bacterium SH139]
MAKHGHLKRLRSATSKGGRRLLQFELLGQRRVLASLTGEVFHDANDSFHRDETEIGLAQRVVFIDLNDDGEVNYGEPVQLTGDDGRFAFNDLEPGDYTVRLFNGTTSQSQNTPFLAEQITDVTIVDPFSDGQAALVGLAGDPLLRSYTAAGAVLTEVNLETAATRSLTFEREIVEFQSLGEGMVVVLLSASGDGEPASPVMLASFSNSSITPLFEDGEEAPPYGADVAINTEGAGLLLPAAEAGVSVPLHSIQFDAEAVSWRLTATTVQVDAAASLWANDSSPIILVSQPAGNGTQVAMWSTITEAIVPDSDHILTDIDQILAFNDQAGLIVARGQAGEVKVIDAANQYATLYSLDDLPGPVTLDGHRELLFSMLDDNMLSIFDIRMGETLVELPLAAAAGVAADIALADGGNRVLIRRPGDISQVRIDQPDAHRVSLTSTDAASKDLLFGMLIHDDNLTPAFPAEPQLQVLEDHTIQLTAPGIMAPVPNPELDTYLTLQISQAMHGHAIVRPDGSLSYVPDADFFGTDSFQILVTDGRDDTGVVTVTVDVLPVDDPVRGININVPEFPETITGPLNIGTIEVEQVDGRIYEILISDPRFGVALPTEPWADYDVIVLEGASFDYETEPSVGVTIHVINPENELDSQFFAAQLLVLDVDEPPTDILPHAAEVVENQAGAEVTELTIVDPDSTSDYVLVTDDPRFVIQDRLLKLAEGIALNHEQVETVIVVPISIQDGAGQTVFSRSVDVTVTDANDPVSDILLSGTQLPEMASGYTVGAISVIDEDSDEMHVLAVNDTRFEIIDDQLKLREGVFVRRSDQAEILVTITATEQNGAAFSKDFLLTVLANESPWTNPEDPTDVDNNGTTNPIDALIIINSLNTLGPRILTEPISYEPEVPRFIDVNGDGRVTPIDALIIINILNRQGDPTAEPEPDTEIEGEGEGPQADQLTPSPSPAQYYSGSPPSSFGYADDDDDDDNRS